MKIQSYKFNSMIICHTFQANNEKTNEYNIKLYINVKKILQPYYFHILFRYNTHIID